MNRAKNDGCTLASVVLNERTRNGPFGTSQPPVVGVVATKERSNTANRSRAVFWGVAARYNVSMKLEMVFVYDISLGARLSEVSVLQISTGRGTHLSSRSEWCRRPQYRAKRTTEMGSRKARWVIKWSDSVLTLQGRCCGHMR